MQCPFPGGKPLNGQYVFVDCLACRHQAASDGYTIYMYKTGATLANTAAESRSGESKMLT